MTQQQRVKLAQTERKKRLTKKQVEENKVALAEADGNNAASGENAKSDNLR